MGPAPDQVYSVLGSHTLSFLLGDLLSGYCAHWARHQTGSSWHGPGRVLLCPTRRRGLSVGAGARKQPGSRTAQSRDMVATRKSDLQFSGLASLPLSYANDYVEVALLMVLLDVSGRSSRRRSKAGGPDNRAHPIAPAFQTR